MKLRICDEAGERVVPASMEMVEQVFAPDAPLRIATEISLTDSGRWLAALALESGSLRPGQEPVQFLLSSGSGGTAVLAGRVERREVVRRFREFILGAGAV
ncbi:MAG: hypothetical protein ACJ8DC_17305 [Gemmatimonadales bacterium]